MSGLKSLRNRIKTVKSTQKITRAMKVVSASKLRKAALQADVSFEYFKDMIRILYNLTHAYDGDCKNSLLFGKSDQPKNYLLVFIASDRGLCGGLNPQVARKVRKRVSELKAANKSFKILCIGKKSVDLLRKDFADNICGEFFVFSRSLSEVASEVTNYIIREYNNDEFDVCEIFYNHYKNALLQEPNIYQFIPFDNSSLGWCNNEPLVGQFLYDPGLLNLIDEIMPVVLERFFECLLMDNFASEQAARMTAMDSATKNAESMIENLTLLLNRSRQAMITKELIEIISGAEAV